MDIIGWLVLAEVIISLFLIIWYIVHLRHHVKRSPAEIALKKHLAELEAEKSEAKASKKASNPDNGKSSELQANIDEDAESAIPKELKKS